MDECVTGGSGVWNPGLQGVHRNAGRGGGTKMTLGADAAAAADDAGAGSGGGGGANEETFILSAEQRINDKSLVF